MEEAFDALSEIVQHGVSQRTSNAVPTAMNRINGGDGVMTVMLRLGRIAVHSVHRKAKSSASK